VRDRQYDGWFFGVSPCEKQDGFRLLPTNALPVVCGEGSAAFESSNSFDTAADATQYAPRCPQLHQTANIASEVNFRTEAHCMIDVQTVNDIFEIAISHGDIV